MKNWLCTSRSQIKRRVKCQKPIVSALGSRRQEDSWSLMAVKPNQGLQVQRDGVLKCKEESYWARHPVYTGLQKLVHRCRHKFPNMCSHGHVYTYPYIQKKENDFAKLHKILSINLKDSNNQGIKSWQGDSICKRPKSDAQIHIMKEEKWLLQVVLWPSDLWPPHCHCGIHVFTQSK